MPMHGDGVWMCVAGWQQLYARRYGVMVMLHENGMLHGGGMALISGLLVCFCICVCVFCVSVGTSVLHVYVYVCICTVRL